MSRVLIPLGLLCLLLSPALAEDAPKKDKASATAAKPEEPTPAQKLKENPNDTEALNAFVSERLGEIYGAMDENLDDADKKLAALKAELEALAPDKADTKTLLSRAKSAVGAAADQIELYRIPLADLEKKLDASADDIAALNKYGRKLVIEIMKASSEDPSKAEVILKDARARLAKVEEAAKEDPVKRQVTLTLKQLTSLERRLEDAKKLLELVGKTAAPLEGQVEAWANGQPLTDADLKGKVVLLDFWAVWCGPCIATFPHLREWNEKYGEKGLVIVGLTRYYNYSWNDDAGRATRSQSKVTPEEEQEMLRKFAEHHSLHHRFGIQKKDGTLDDYYAVSGIPHVVVIDQEGKVRLIRVGSGPKNAKDIGNMLEKLLAGNAEK